MNKLRNASAIGSVSGLLIGEIQLIPLGPRACALGLAAGCLWALMTTFFWRRRAPLRACPAVVNVFATGLGACAFLAAALVVGIVGDLVLAF